VLHIVVVRNCGNAETRNVKIFFSVIKSRRMMRNVYKILVEKPERKRLLGRLGRRWEGILYWILGR
jgi:hypothetical protein